MWRGGGRLGLRVHKIGCRLHVWAHLPDELRGFARQLGSQIADAGRIATGLIKLPLGSQSSASRVGPHLSDYSMTSSARASSEGATVNPIAFAAF